MKKLLLLGILFLIGFIGKAQKVYFIYLETEKGIPFYVKMGDKIYSSSTAGYLILSNLKDSTYTFAIGLSGKRQAEPRFQVAVASTDHGFLIKELDQKLNLFNLQSLELMAPLAAVETKNDTYTSRGDIFTRTLALAVNDPSLLLEVVKKEPVQAIAKGKSTQKEVEPVVAIVKDPIVEKSISTDSIATIKAIDTAVLVTSQPEANKEDTGATVDTKTFVDSTTVAVVDTLISTETVAVAIADTVILKDTVATVTEPISEKANNVEATDLRVDSSTVISEASKEVEIKATEPEYKKSIIVRRSESSTTQGFGLTFIDQIAETSDTIRILIPNPKSPIFKTSSEAKPEVKAQLKTIADIEASAQVDTTGGLVNTTAKMATNEPVSVELSNCNSLATERDFKKLQKEMASLETDEGMINTAMLVFKDKCFTTEQIKNLSTLFLAAQWKYQFFAAAQKSVSDKEKFPSLQSEIQDDYYVNQFKALLSK
jgi:preprotein translocase subunit YajC